MSSMTLPKLGNLLQLGNPVSALPVILQLFLGGGDPKAKALAAVQKLSGAQQARSSGKVLAFQGHKAISALAQHTPAEHRAEVVRAYAASIALQAAEFAEEAIKFGELAIERENQRGKPGEDAAVEARESGEEAIIQAGIDIGRVIAGQTLGVKS